MDIDEFKRQLSVLIQENRNSEAIGFVAKHLPAVRNALSPADRLLVADWMEGVQMALDLGVDHQITEARN
ncbi:MAG: hypothetical protein IT306_19155 [Chloroflexi bacterium]|nr:hypothetical protein [Chloroflexota bacterium]